MNRNVIISTDSGCDLGKKLLNELNVPFIKMRYCDSDECYPDTQDEAKTKEFYKKMRNGVIYKTTSIVPDEAYEFFNNICCDDLPIIHISLGSAISSTYNNVLKAKQMLNNENKKNKIYVIDSLGASICYGLLVLEAVKMRDQGFKAEEIVEKIENIKRGVTPIYTTPTLEYLRKSGRISNFNYFIGNILSIKPILKLDENGKLFIATKTNGIKNTYSKIINLIKDAVIDPNEQILYIGHGDNIDEAKKLGELIMNNINFKEVRYSLIGPTIGSHSGPDLLCAYFFGKNRK